MMSLLRNTDVEDGEGLLFSVFDAVITVIAAVFVVPLLCTINNRGVGDDTIPFLVV